MKNKVLAGLLACGIAVLSCLTLRVLNSRESSELRGPQDFPTDGTSQAFDFGEKRVGETVNHTFTVSNPTGSVLHVLGFRPDCSCTVVNTDIREVQPFGKVAIPLSVQLAFASDKMGSRVAVLLANHSPILLTITGRVIQDLPGQVEFGEFARGDRITRDLYLQPVAGHSCSVRNVEYDHKYVRVSTGPDGDNSAVTRVRIEPAPEIPFGKFRTTLVVNTDDPNQGAKLVVISGDVFSPLCVSPARIGLGIVRGSQDVHKILKLSSPYNQDVAFQSAEGPLYVTLNGDVVQSDRSHVAVPISIHINGSEAGVFKRELIITAKVDEAEIQTMVEVYGFVQSAEGSREH